MARNDSHAAKLDDLLARSKDLITAVWADRLSRVCAVVGAVSLWLTVTLTEPVFALPLFGASFGLWFLRGHRALRCVVVDDDDWL